MSESTDTAALLALEATTRSRIASSSSTAASEISAALIVALTSDPPASGTEFLSRRDVEAAITTALAASQVRDTDTTSAAYLAAALMALNALIKPFKQLGHDLPQTLPALGPALGQLLTDLDSSHGTARLTLHDLIRAAYDGVSGPRDAAEAARVAALRGAVLRAVRDLNNRATASAVVGVYRGFNDAQLAVFREFQQIHSYTRIEKEWVVQSTTPCHHCKALDGTRIPVTDAFDPDATVDPHKTKVPTNGTLLSPPRHPNCRCHLQLHVVTRTA